MRLAISRFWSRPSGAESRISSRVRPLRSAPVEVQIMGRRSLDVLHVRDISATGLGVYVAHRFEGCDIDAEVDLVLTLPGSRPFLTRGVIRHNTRGEGDASGYFGVEFSLLQRGQRALIEAYVVTRSE